MNPANFFSHESVSRLTVRRSASSIRENISLAARKKKKIRLLGKKQRSIRYPCSFHFISPIVSSYFSRSTRIFVTSYYTRERERIFPRARWSRNNLTDVFPKYGKTGDTRRGCNRAEPRAAIWCKHWTLRPLKAHATQTCRWLLTRSTASITLRIVSFPSRTKFYSLFYHLNTRAFFPWFRKLSRSFPRTKMKRSLRGQILSNGKYYYSKNISSSNRRVSPVHDN